MRRQWSNEDGIWLAGVDGCRAGWVVAFVRPRRRRGAHPGGAALCRILIARRKAGRHRRRYADRPAGAHRHWRARRRECDPAAARRAAIVGVLGAVARRASQPPTIARPARSRLRPPIRRAKSRKQLFMIAPKIREVDACLRDDPALAARVLRSASGTRVLAAQWRARADRTEEGQGQAATSRGLRCAAAC